ncbi:MAG: hypothetical protein EBR02_06160 [Alphaproteobacteria bacterium]|nr:hypothetical protein [Alphaproteobacteria bacterium]
MVKKNGEHPAPNASVKEPRTLLESIIKEHGKRNVDLARALDLTEARSFQFLSGVQRLRPSFIPIIKQKFHLSDEEALALVYDNLPDINPEKLEKMPVDRRAGAVVRGIRESRELKAKDCADILGTCSATISNWENAKGPVGGYPEKLVKDVFDLHGDDAAALLEQIQASNDARKQIDKEKPRIAMQGGITQVQMGSVSRLEPKMRSFLIKLAQEKAGISV